MERDFLIDSLEGPSRETGGEQGVEGCRCCDTELTAEQQKKFFFFFLL